MKIADIHAHIFPHKLAEKASASIGDFYGMHSKNTASLETLMQLEAEAGIERFAVSSSATTANQVSHINDFIAESCMAHPGLVGLGTLFPGMEDWEEELDRMQDLGIRGVKIHSDFQHVPLDAPEAVEMYRAVARRGMPVLFHMGDDRFDYSAPERLTNLIRKVPDLIAIAAHFGGWRAWDRSFAHPQSETVFYDTSSSLMYLSKERALEFLDKFGADRFLFGTDFPMWTPAEELRRFLDLGLDETTRDRILYGNFERLFGPVSRP